MLAPGWRPTMSSIREYLDIVRSLAGESLGESSVTEEDLDEVEDELGVPLPPSYRELVMSCDASELYSWGGHVIYWAGDDVPEHFGILSANGGKICPKFLVPVIEVG